MTLNKLFKQIRSLEQNISKLQGEIKIDESYFEAKRIRGKRGRGAERKTPVFFTHYIRSFLQEGILKRDSNVYTQIVMNYKTKTLIPIIRKFSKLQKTLLILIS